MPGSTSRARVGPSCVKQFADFGADVIKVESPADANDDQDIGSRDGFGMQNLDRNERSMTPPAANATTKRIGACAWAVCGRSAAIPAA